MKIYATSTNNFDNWHIVRQIPTIGSCRNSITYWRWQFRVKLLLGKQVGTIIRVKGEQKARAKKIYLLWTTGEGSARGQISRFRQVISPATKRKKNEANCSRLHQRPREEGPPIRSNIVSSVANITASSGSTPCNARWDVNGAAGSPNEDKSYPKWRPYLFPAPPFAFFLHSSSASFVPPSFIECN